MNTTNKMKLNDILELSYTNSNKKNKITTLNDVYGIIYRIFCIPEKKSYIGQTFSHYYCGKYITRFGILKRMKAHYKCKDLELSKDRPLYVALNTYTPENFEVFEELTIHSKDLAKINNVEGDYIKKYNCLIPNGYNFEEVGKRRSKMMTDIFNLYDVKNETKTYIDVTRERRCKEIGFTSFFKLKRNSVTDTKIIFDLFKTVDIEKIRLLESTEVRMIVKVKNQKDNIRFVMKEWSKDAFLNFAKSLSDNIEISESFREEDCYKYETKIENVIIVATI